MNKKVRKSVVATSLAAATLVSSAFHHSVKAEETNTTNPDEVIKNQEDKKVESTELTEKAPVTLDQVEEAAEKVADLEGQVADESKALEEASASSEEADQAVAQAEEAVKTAEELVEEATDENIAKAETAVETADAEIKEQEKRVTAAQDDLGKAQQAVTDQESKVAEQEQAVEAAKSALKEATKPLVKEEQAVNAAKDVVNAAETDLTNKEAALKQTEVDAATAIAESQKNQAAINQTQAALNQTKQAVQAKESEIEQAKRNNQNRAVLKDTGYAGFLATVDGGLFSQASQKYAENGLNPQNGGIASIQGALQAVEVMKLVNAYRARAGLPELYVDLAKNVESQIQTVGFINKGTHTFQFFNMETVAWSTSVKTGVDFWYNEKPKYMATAQASGWTTNETQLNANNIYMANPSAFISDYGHYATMMGNEFNTISAAVTNSNGFVYSEAGFHKATNLQAGLQNGTIMTVANYEKALRNYLTNASLDVNLSGLNAELNNLRQRQSQQESQLNNLKNKQTSLNTTISNQDSNIATAKADVEGAKRNLQASKAKVEEKQAIYDQALAAMANKIKPQTDALATEEARLEVENAALATVKSNLANAENSLQAQKDALVAAYTKKDSATEKVSLLKNAAANLTTAQEALEAAKASQEEAGIKKEAVAAKLEILQSLLDQAKAEYKTLLDQYIAENPEANLVSLFANTSLENAGIEAGNLAEGVDLTQTSGQTYLPTSYNGQEVSAELTSVKPAQVASQEEGKGQTSQNHSGDKAKVLPNTGSQESAVAVAGVLAASLAAGLAVKGASKREED